MTCRMRPSSSVNVLGSAQGSVPVALRDPLAESEAGRGLRPGGDVDAAVGASRGKGAGIQFARRARHTTLPANEIKVNEHK